MSRKRTGLVAQGRDELVLVEGDGTVRVARRAGGSLREVGRVEGPPAAMSADGKSLLVAVQDGPIMESTDGGRTWKVRVAS